jgi:hypothetical protein
VLFSPLPRGVFSGFSRFPPSVKINTPKFQLDSVEEEPLCGTTVNSYFFYFFIFSEISQSDGSMSGIDDNVRSDDVEKFSNRQHW